MSPNISTLHTRCFIAFAFGALLLTSASAAPTRPGAAQRPPANLKLDQVDSKTSAITKAQRPTTNARGVEGGSTQTAKLAPATSKMEPPNAAAKGGKAAKWELSELDAAKGPRTKTANTAKAASGDEAGTLKQIEGGFAKHAPRSPDAGSGSLPTRKSTTQYNPKELAVDKRK